MLNTPILKFEKSSNYLNSQLQTQNNNKQLILDIITNIGLLINSSSKDSKAKYDEILEAANNYLKNISSNITAIEQLYLEITNITKELNSLLEEQNKASKTKEFYIAAFSNIKHNMVLYSEKFQNIETKLEKDNNEFNEFININNFKYNFNSIHNDDEDSNSYEFTGFSVDETNELDETSNEESLTDNMILEENEQSKDTNILEENEINENVLQIENLTNKFKELLLDISDGNITEEASIKIDEYINEVKSNLSIPNALQNNDTTDTENTDIEPMMEESSEDNSFIPIFLKYTDEDIEFLNQLNKENENEFEIATESIVQESINPVTSEFNFENDIPENSIQDDNNNVISESKLENNIQEISIQDDNNIISESKLENDIPENSIQDNNNVISESKLENDIPENSIQDNNNVISESILKNDVSENNIQENVNKVVVTDIENLIANVKSSDFTSKVENDIESTFNNIEELIEDNQKETTSSNNIENKNNSEITDTENNLDNIENTEIIVENIDNEKTIVDENIVESMDNSEIIADEDILSNLDNTDLILDILNEDENLLLDSITNEDNEETKVNNQNNISGISNHENKKSEFNELDLSDEDINNKISNLLTAQTDNDNLIISEKNQKIYLPYKITELVNYMDSYPNVYSSLQDVVKQEFILPFDYFHKHPFKSRFLETYNIVKNREGKNIFKAISYSFNLAKKSNLNPAVVAACKSLNELESYLYYLDANNLKRFKFFNIIYQINLL